MSLQPANINWKLQNVSSLTLHNKNKRKYTYKLKRIEISWQTCINIVIYWNKIPNKKAKIQSTVVIKNFINRYQ